MKVREGERGWGCGEDEVHCVAGFLSEMLTACAQEHGNKVCKPKLETSSASVCPTMCMSLLCMAYL